MGPWEGVTLGASNEVTGVADVLDGGAIFFLVVSGRGASSEATRFFVREVLEGAGVDSGSGAC